MQHNFMLMCGIDYEYIKSWLNCGASIKFNKQTSKHHVSSCYMVCNLKQ